MDPTVLGALIGGVLATIGGVLGGIVTGWFTLMANKQSLAQQATREERERGLAFRREQLSQFYGPVLACMEELEESWQLLFDADKHVEKFSASHRHENQSGEFLLDKQKAVVEYKQYLYAREVAVFNKIKEIFISHFGLAEPSTKENYRAVVRFIENRNIINVTERKLDITFTGEDASGVRNRIASLFQNLIDINSQIRNQLECGEPKPIIQETSESPGPPERAKEESAFTPPVTQQSFVVAGETQTVAKPPPVAAEPLNKTFTRQNWPGRYTLLSNKAALESAMAAAQPAENGVKSANPQEMDKLAGPQPNPQAEVNSH
jgi:hypothetical protein